MNDKQLEAFLQIAECGSFSQAEELLYTSKQALVKRINTLEDELGFSLFYRDFRGIELTEAGKEFYKGTKELLAMRTDIINRCRRVLSSSSTLKISRIESHMLMDKITYRFAEKYPDFKLMTIMHHDKNERLRVANRITDIGESPKVKEIDDLDLNYTKLIELPYICLMNNQHPLSKEKRITLDQLSRYPLTIDIRQFEIEQVELLTHIIPILHQSSAISDQIHKVFQICSSDAIFLTPAYYSRFMHPLTAIPLDVPWTREYGLVTRKNSSEIVQKYLEVAKKIYHS